MSTTDVYTPKTYTLKTSMDYIAGDLNNFLFSPHLLTGLVDQYMDLDIYAGVGAYSGYNKIDFLAGATVKFNILPDINNQLGLAFLTGLRYFSSKSGSASMAFLNLLTSKSFNLNSKSIFSPYGSIEVGSFFSEKAINNYKTNPINIKVGTSYSNKKIPFWTFFVESNLKIKNSHNSLSLGVTRSL